MLDNVNVTPYVFVCAPGAPLPPFALYVTVYVSAFHWGFNENDPQPFGIVAPGAKSTLFGSDTHFTNE